MTCPTTRTIEARRISRVRKAAFWLGGLSLLGAITYLIATAETGPRFHGTEFGNTWIDRSCVGIFRWN
ncbi:MAG: hypothetical protein EB107_03545 [Proteobacteria bacterium]|nr:hypothetical protein [Pseudomonadota bacterium]